MKKKSKKQAVLDAKAKADAKWDIWVKTHDTSAHDARDSINQELHDKEQMSNDSKQIKKLTNERDEARREAYRHWLLFKYASADLRSETAECRLLSRIYKDMFNSPPNAIMSPPYGINAEEHE